MTPLLHNPAERNRASHPSIPFVGVRAHVPLAVRRLRATYGLSSAMAWTIAELAGFNVEVTR